MVFIFGIFGLIIGSFLNVLIWRLNDPKAPKFWQGRSICPKCKHQLNWADNIPLVSFLFLGGKCHYCHKKISWQYPLVELLTAIVTILLSPNIFIVLLGYCFIVIFFSDLIYGFIPDEMILVGIIIVIARSITTKQSIFCTMGEDCFASLAMTGILAFIFFLLIYLATRTKGLGFGDVKLAFLMGLLLGFPKIIVAMWVAFIIGGLVALILLLLRKTKISATIPLGPFLVLGLIVAALWSSQILRFLGVLL